MKRSFVLTPEATPMGLANLTGTERCSGYRHEDSDVVESFCDPARTCAIQQSTPPP